jgi:hypothetical protein
MKTPMSKSPQVNKKTHVEKTRPEIRDNLDSRANEEQQSRGDDVTHNRKPHHNIKSGRKESYR